MESKAILVTGIGGNVGQGIVRNLRELPYPLIIVGTNTVAQSGGNHMVDKFYQVPPGNTEEYVSVLKEIIVKEDISLIIPSTDFESYTISQLSDSINTIVATSGPESTGIFLDKYNTYLFCAANNIPFAASCLPSDFKNQYMKAIAKPRQGRGSRGLIPDYKGIPHVNDDEYVVQEMLTGIEITSAAYISYKTNEVLGIITMERNLENGTTTYCRVVDTYDSQVDAIFAAILSKTDVRGSVNLQSIVTPSGEVIPFEVNCRISGTNSIRSQFGFKDVKYTVEELLLNKSVPEIIFTKGLAFRYMSDVIYPNGIIKYNITDDFILF